MNETSHTRLTYNTITGGKIMEHLQSHAVKKINEICDRYSGEKTPLIMILSDIQNEYGYIPLPVQQLVAKRTGLSLSEIYGVVTFYSFFSAQLAM